MQKEIHAITKIISKFGLKNSSFSLLFFVFAGLMQVLISFVKCQTNTWFTQIKTVFKQLHGLYFRPPTNTLGI